MIEKFNNYFEKKTDIQNLQDDITTLIKDDDKYIKSDEPLELVQITGLLTDEEEIKKIEESWLELEENMTIDKNLNVGEVKRGQIIYLTALLKRPGTSYNNQTIGVLKVRVVDYYYGLNKLTQIMK